MDTSHPSRESPRPPTISSGDARQGEIILRKPWQRVVFFGGLVGCVVLVILVRIFAGV